MNVPEKKSFESKETEQNSIPLISADDENLNPALEKIFEERDVVDRLQSLPIWLISLVVQLLIIIVLAMFHIGEKGKSDLELISQPSDDETFDMDSLDDGSLDIADFDIEVEESPQVIEQPVTDFTAMETVPDMTLADTLDLTETDIAQPVQTVPMVGALEGRTMGKGRLLKSGGGNSESEKAVNDALKWLAAHQLPNGSWSFKDAGADSGNVDAVNAATAMGILPFLGAGNTPTKGEYKDVVARGLEYLMSSGTPSADGYDLRDLGESINTGGRMYSHGLASIALCEACAMTAEDKGKQIKALRSAAQQAIFFIQYAQDPAMGGWRYSPKESGDTSVTGWQVMALKSGTMGGLSVEPTVMKKAINFFANQVANSGGSRYGYQSQIGTDATTAIGLLCRLYLDWTPSHQTLLSGADYLLSKGPNFDNAYYIYYATQVLHHIGGPRWTQWNSQVRDTLVHSQIQGGEDSGSWAPGQDVYGRNGGRLYVTSLFCMTLEVYYRHMPLYAQSQFGQEEEIDFPLD